MRRRLNDCRRIIRQSNIEIFCSLETKISIDPVLHSLLHKRIQLFFVEGSTHNFDYDFGGHILLKWNYASILFNPLDNNP